MIATRQAAMQAAEAEVLELADRMAAGIPDGARPPLIFNALNHMLASGVIGAAVSADAARGTVRYIAARLVQNADTMIERGWRKWD